MGSLELIAHYDNDAYVALVTKNALTESPTELERPGLGKGLGHAAALFALRETAFPMGKTLPTMDAVL